LHPTIRLPAPAGPHAVGVVDFELIDPTREEIFAPGTPRRIPVRAWYPAKAVSGNPRPYAKALEMEQVIGRFFTTSMPLGASLAAILDVPTHSVEGAPPLTGGPRPTVVFSHGVYSFIQSNTALMEHLASHGYLVVAISHPYTACATVHENGEVIPADEALFKETMARGFNPRHLSAYIDPDIDTRYEAMQRNLREFVLAPHFLVWERDCLHTIDRLVEGALPGAGAMLRPLVDRERIGTVGMSFGSSVSAAAHHDARVRATVDLDGGIFDEALLGTDVNAATLIMHGDFQLGLSGHVLFPHSEFFFEPLTSIGTRKDVIRVETKGAMHYSYTDLCLIPDEVFETMPSAAALRAPIEGQRMARIVNDFVLRFFDHYLCGTGPGLDAAFRAGYPEVVDVDLGYVREWAAARFK
jgi:predicted dienelactone hydrolase